MKLIITTFAEIPQHFVNIASFARIETNATCGDAWFGPEAYCIPSASSDRKYKLHCSVCSRGEYGDSFPITNALHDSMTWWQSPTLARGSEFNWVTITLDLRQVITLKTITISATWLTVQELVIILRKNSYYFY